MYGGSRSRRCAAQHVVAGPRGAGAQAVVADELGGAGYRLVGVDHGLRDPGHLQQHRLDLGQLDAVAADLDLQVDPAEVLDLAVGSLTRPRSPVR